jgi:hypothetical protein
MHSHKHKHKERDPYQDLLHHLVVLAFEGLLNDLNSTSQIF